MKLNNRELATVRAGLLLLVFHLDLLPHDDGTYVYELADMVPIGRAMTDNKRFEQMTMEEIKYLNFKLQVIQELKRKSTTMIKCRNCIELCLLYFICSVAALALATIIAVIAGG